VGFVRVKLSVFLNQCSCFIILPAGAVYAAGQECHANSHRCCELAAARAQVQQERGVSGHCGGGQSAHEQHRYDPPPAKLSMRPVWLFRRMCGCCSLGACVIAAVEAHESCFAVPALQPRLVGNVRRLTVQARCACSMAVSQGVFG
jgi:hypothetical protein